MTAAAPPPRRPVRGLWKKLLVFLSVFGPATITAMADNDAGGVATYSVAGATLGYPILFALVWITLLLALTQEMGMRLTLVTRKGLADLIRERYGVRAALFIFSILLIANIGTLITELTAIETTCQMLGIPLAPLVVAGVVVFSFVFIVRGNYRLTQAVMLLTSLFFVVYIISAARSNPDWGLALRNLAFPQGVAFSPQYLRDYLVIGLGVLGTTITPWGQFFISSFAYDKKIEPGKIGYAQLETYWGAFLTNFFSFFMIVATAATLFAHGLPLVSGEQAALAIRPFAGDLAGTLFAIGILNAGFMGLVIVSLSTAYAFAEFFGIAGSLNDSFKQSRAFYGIYLVQLALATTFTLVIPVSLFQVAIVTQIINAIGLPFVFYYLIQLTRDRELMGAHANHRLQTAAAVACTVVIAAAAVASGVMAWIGP